MAEIKIIDSFKEIRSTTKKYNFIVVDNPAHNYGENEQHVEHFDLFPDIFRVMKNETILILNAIPSVEPVPSIERYKEKFPSLFCENQLRGREQFYSTDKPENISFQQMVTAYSKYAKSFNFNVEWFFVQRRSFAYYLVLKLKFVNG